MEALEKKEYGDAYAELKKIQKALMKPYRDESTGQPDTSEMSAALIKKLRELENQIQAEARKHRTRNT
ncbi:MAG: hypothetical protein EOM41_08230, partial [Bacilli bacterium]|nr:hypothetical protein [Bacilli bacterium]